ncbi:MAG: ABC transporter ATP-binding protein [Deltaproteobacteria bacterium]|nr:ABC transporter ATP-binding protein [Deltaproteobacteria bacterium]
MPLLQVKNLTKRFGGLKAVNNVSFDIHSDEIVGLIGANGAGKTTLFNLISGILHPEGGDITLDGRPLNQLSPPRRSLAGLGRTFQIVRPFAMTVLENVMVPLLARDPHMGKAREEGMQVLALLRLEHLADTQPDSLTLAQRKRIEVARALATRPKLLMLDEVLAGLNPTEISENLPIIRQVHEQGVTIFIIEHLMDALMAVSQRVLVMDQGAIIASGTPQEVTSNECVIKAYLGEETPNC